jgi:hypothetical protein
MLERRRKVGTKITRDDTATRVSDVLSEWG